MTGFEVVGVVLGVLPLLSSTIGTYDNVYRPFITQYKDYEPALKGFQQGLLTERTIFRYDCIMLLRSSVGSEWVQDMLENLQHDRWRDEDIEEKVSQHLGSSKEACEAAIARIQGKLSAILKEYQRYGITTNSESLNNNSGHIEHLYWKLKFCWSEGRLDQKLQDLRTCNQSFHTWSELVMVLTKGEKRLYGPGDDDHKAKQYDSIQQASSQLCRALKTACINHQEHSAHFGLDVDRINLSRIRFEITFNSNTIDTVHSPVWLGIESEFMGKARRFNVNSCHNTPITSADPVLSHPTPGFAHKQRISYHLFPWRGFYRSALHPNSLSSIDLDEAGQCQASKSEETVHEPPLICLDIHRNLCEHVSLSAQRDVASTQERRLIGSLNGDEYTKHLVYLIPRRSLGGIGANFSLLDLISSGRRGSITKTISPYDKLRLARQFAEAVLQFHSTPLLAPTWRSEDIIFFDSQEPKKHVKLPRPYLQVQFRENDLTSHTYPGIDTHGGDSDSEDENEDGIRNQYLYRLAIMLIEIAHLEPIDTLYEKHVRAKSENYMQSEYKVLQTLSKNLSIEVGPRFGKVVRRCLGCTFGQGTKFTDPQLRVSFYRDVVCELEKLEIILREAYT